MLDLREGTDGTVACGTWRGSIALCTRWLKKG
jgi:hypothetical protein